MRASVPASLTARMTTPGSRRQLFAALVVQGAVVLVTVPLYGLVGLSIPSKSIGAQLVFPGFFGFAALLTARDRNGIPQALAALTVLLMAFPSIGAAQYLAAAWSRPLVDDHLLAADAALGIHQAALVAWTNAHTYIRSGLAVAYKSLLPQFLLPVVVLGFLDHRELWRYVRCFQCIAILTIIMFGLWPAGVPALHGIPEVISQGEAMAQFFALRAGTMTTLRLEVGQGIISFPSFHAAGALIVTWALRRTWFFWPVAALNAALLASTVLLGLHYVIDVIAAVGVCAVVIVVERAVRPWLEPSVSSHPSGPRATR